MVWFLSHWSFDPRKNLSPLHFYLFEIRHDQKNFQRSTSGIAEAISQTRCPSYCATKTDKALKKHQICPVSKDTPKMTIPRTNRTENHEYSVQLLKKTSLLKAKQMQTWTATQKELQPLSFRSWGMQKIYEATTTTTTTKVLKLQKCFCLLASASTNVNSIILSSNKIHNVSR